MSVQHECVQTNNLIWERDERVALGADEEGVLRQRNAGPPRNRWVVSSGHGTMQYDKDFRVCG